MAAETESGSTTSRIAYPEPVIGLCESIGEVERGEPRIISGTQAAAVVCV